MNKLNYTAKIFTSAKITLPKNATINIQENKRSIVLTINLNGK